MVVLHGQTISKNTTISRHTSMTSIHAVVCSLSVCVSHFALYIAWQFKHKQLFAPLAVSQCFPAMSSVVLPVVGGVDEVDEYWDMPTLISFKSIDELPERRRLQRRLWLFQKERRYLEQRLKVERHRLKRMRMSPLTERF